MPSLDQVLPWFDMRARKHACFLRAKSLAHPRTNRHLCGAGWVTMGDHITLLT